MHVYSSDPMSYASKCFSVRLPPSFHCYLLGKKSINLRYPAKYEGLLVKGYL